MSIYRQRLENNLDRKINLQYFEISFCENQRQKAQRLLKPREDRQTSQQKLTNEQLLLYVKDVYLKYGIQDPILKMRKQRETHPLPLKDKQIKISERLSKTKNKLASLKEKFKSDRQQVIEKSLLTTSFKQESINPHKIIEKPNKAIGYRTKQKIRFKTVRDEIQTFNSLYLLNERLNYSYNCSRNQSISFSIANQKQAKMKFLQFCPFCEQILSLANYKSHQIRCNQFKGIQNISTERLMNTLQLKIAELQSRLILQLSKKTPKNVADQFKKLRIDLIHWIEMEKDITYKKIHCNFNKILLGLWKGMSKLQWFRNFHNSLYLSPPFDPYL